MGVGYVYLHIFSRDLDKILKDNYYAYKCLYNFPLSEMNFYGEPDKEEEVMKLRESYEEYFYDSERYFITEYWHVLRFLLIVKGGLLISEGHTSLNYCVFGKHSICNGEVKYLTSEEVKEISVALNKVDTNVLVEMYDCNEFNQNRVYLKSTSWEPEDITGIIEAFQAITQFYNKASLAGSAMLIGIY